MACGRCLRSCRMEPPTYTHRDHPSNKLRWTKKAEEAMKTSTYKFLYCRKTDYWTGLFWDLGRRWLGKIAASLFNNRVTKNIHPQTSNIERSLFEVCEDCPKWKQNQDWLWGLDCDSSGWYLKKWIEWHDNIFDNLNLECTFLILMEGPVNKSRCWPRFLPVLSAQDCQETLPESEEGGETWVRSISVPKFRLGQPNKNIWLLGFAVNK